MQQNIVSMPGNLATKSGNIFLDKSKASGPECPHSAEASVHSGLILAEKLVALLESTPDGFVARVSEAMALDNVLVGLQIEPKLFDLVGELLDL